MRIAVLLACALFAEGAAQACDWPRWPSDATPAVQTERWLAAEPGCRSDAAFLAAFGHWLNEQARYLEAADRLERALLLEPQRKDAEIDYAIALAGSGDAASALTMLDALLADPALPESLRPELARRQSQLRRPPWVTWVRLSGRVGRDSNLLGAPNLQTLTLTLPGANVVLPLSDGFRARPGNYLTADLQIEARRQTLDGERWDIFANLRRRHSPQVSDAAYDQYDLAVERSVTAAGSGHYANFFASGLHSVDRNLLAVQGVGGGLSQPWLGQCHFREGLELQNRTYPYNSILDGRYAGILVRAGCVNGEGWLVSLRAGRDFARDADRPGGDQTQVGLLLNGRWRVGGGALLADMQAYRQRDERGYSDLLDNGRVRTLRRHTLRLEYQRALSPHLSWALGYEGIVQYASLDLFSLRSAGPYAMLRWLW